MKTVICSLNSKFAHTCLALRCLKEYAKDCGFSPEIAEYTINHELRKIVADLYAKKADFYGFSVYIFNLTETMWVIRDLKKLLPSAFIFCGGPEVSFEEERFLRENPEVDLVLRGEGENTFAELLGMFETVPKDELKDVFYEKKTEGLSYYNKGVFFKNPDRRPECSLDAFPFPYRDRDDLLRIKDKILYYESARGCPFGCSYCMSSLERSVRTLSLSRTFEDLSVFLSVKARLVKFVDRTFNADKKRCLEILRFLRDHDNGVTSFHFELSPSLIDREFLALIQDVREGLFLFESGLQSANPETLKAVGRRQDTLSLAPIFAEIAKSRAHLHLDLIAGLPYENYESFGRSFDVAMSFRPDVLQLGFLKVLKGAPISRQEEHGLQYSDKPPYEILKNKYISFDELEKLKKIEEITERFFNSGLFRDSVLFFADRLFGGGFFAFTESLAAFLETKDFFSLSVSDSMLPDLLHAWLEEQSLSAETKAECENRMAFDMYRKSPVLNPPAWLKNLPDKERLVSILKDSSSLLPFLPPEIAPIFPGEDPKKWYRRARVVSFLLDGKNKSWLFLYPDKTITVRLND